MIRYCLFVAFVATLGHCQNPRTQTRLGLLATGLGLPPVPGASTINTNPVLATQRQDNCACIAINQLCDPNDNSFILNNPPPININTINTRIVNRHNPNDPNVACGRDRQLCCLSGLSTGGASGQLIDNFNARPTHLQNGCGVQRFQYNNPHDKEAAFGEFPWMVIILGRNDAYLGGGVLIAPNWILTGAIKVYNQRNIKVRLGDHNSVTTKDHSQYNHVELNVVRIVTHPQFDSNTLQNNVALLQVQGAGLQNINSYPHINTACLPESGQLFQGQTCFVSGFGTDSFRNGQYQSVLKKVGVEVLDPFRCEALLRNTRLGPTFQLDKNSFLCAGGEKDKDACTGDGGSPLVCNVGGKWTLAGLVAWGIECGGINVPGVYVNVANFVDFIHKYASFS